VFIKEMMMMMMMMNIHERVVAAWRV